MNLVAVNEIFDSETGMEMRACFIRRGAIPLSLCCCSWALQGRWMSFQALHLTCQHKSWRTGPNRGHWHQTDGKKFTHGLPVKWPH